MRKFLMALLGLVGFGYDHFSKARALRFDSERSSWFYGTHPDVKAFEAEMDHWYA